MKIASLLLTLILSTLVLLPLWAGPLVVGGTNWYEFGFGNSGSSATACPSCTPSSGGNSVDAGSPPWTFSGAANLTVVDAFLSGDNFSVYDNGNLVGTTPVVAQDHNCGDNPVPCLADPLMSHAVFTVGAGSHSITITAVNAVSGGGAAYFRLDPGTVTGVPVLSTPAFIAMALMLAGLGSFLAVRAKARGVA